MTVSQKKFGTRYSPMTVRELEAILIANEVPTTYYSFDGMGGGDNYVLQQENGTWKTFYSERGGADDVHTYANEDEACRGIFTLVARMMRSSQHRDISLGLDLPLPIVDHGTRQLRCVRLPA